MKGRPGRRHTKMMILRAAILAVMSFLLASCGGGGGYSGGGSTTTYTYSISGTITSHSVGLAGVTVGLSGSPTGTATTGASGNYTFSGLTNGQTIYHHPD